MRELVSTLRRCLSTRVSRVWWALLALAGVAVSWAPLVQGPGYELATALTALCAVPGGAFAVAAHRSLTATAWRHHLAVATALAGAMVPGLLSSILRTRLGSACDPWLHLGFVPVLLLPTCLLVAPLAAAVAGLTRRGWAASLLWLLVLALSAAWALWPIVFGPQVFFFGHLLGWVPGPLYDEALSVSAPLLWFRGATLAFAVALIAFHARRLTLAALALAAGLAVEVNATSLGFRMTDEALARELGGHTVTDELELFYPAGFSDEQVSRLLGDLRFRHHQLVDFFGEAPQGRARVWWYRSAAEKHRLVGAAHTQFAKPWRREVHVNGLAFPHPVIKHELVHALAAPWGAWPWGVTARYGGLSLNVGVIEGFAVAADNPVDDLSLEQWAAAMKKKSLLPDVRALMTPTGFYAAPHTRAYATAGAFLRFLADRHGKPKLRRLYRDGDFDAAYGAPLGQLATEFEAHLDTVALDESAVNQAFGRFRQGALFDRPCAREVVHLRAESAATPPDAPERALALLRRCRALQPQDPGHPLAEARLLRQAQRLEAASALLDEELARRADDPSAWADAALLRADLAQEMDDAQTARALWQRVLERAPPPAIERTARVRLLALDLPPATRDDVTAWFGDEAEELKLLRLREATLATPAAWVPAYLLGRALGTSAHQAHRAGPWLEQTIAAAPAPAIVREAQRVRLEVLFAQGRCDDLVSLAATYAPDPAFTARARDWAERCTFTFANAPR